MAELHEALKSLGPCDFSQIPTSPNELDAYVSDLFSNSQLILESVPITPPEDIPPRPRSQTTSSVASRASEISISTARSAPPAPEYTALQKEWGKSIKLSAKENPLGMSVYKLAGKDGKGAWFARRSVHEGLGFARFKKGLEREFPESTAVQGAPGEGNIRGIGGEKKYEDIKIDGKGRVEVYHLSAQFPGPTTPRDFVTLLVTSSKAMKDKERDSHLPELSPRHYMIISKPCSHPECPQKSGLIRGSYESVEFIREVPRKLKKSTSALDMEFQRKAPDTTSSLEKEAATKNAQRRTHFSDTSKSTDDLNQYTENRISDGAFSGRKRSSTVGIPESPMHDRKHPSDIESYDPEQNPVEWIMVTRSDPGGSVPRWMVERGTPSSIVADASKFLDWACQKELTEDEEPEEPGVPHPVRLDSFQSWQANGHLAGIKEQEAPSQELQGEPFPTMSSSDASIDSSNQISSNGLLASMTGMVSSTLNTYAPQAVLDRLPLSTAQRHPTLSTDTTMINGSKEAIIENNDDDDASSTISSTSFASADSHIDSDDTRASPVQSQKSLTSKQDSDTTAQEKELAKLSQRRAALDAKLNADREKLTKDVELQTVKEREAIKKAEEKHEKELKKSEERYRKEIAKLEDKKKKEDKKLEEKRKKQIDKDEKARLTRERDEARNELELLKKEKELWLKQVGELQAENTRLAARIAKLEGGTVTPVGKSVDEEVSGGGSGMAKTRGEIFKRSELSSGGRKRSSSLNFRSRKTTESAGS